MQICSLSSYAQLRQLGWLGLTLLRNVCTGGYHAFVAERNMQLQYPAGIRPVVNETPKVSRIRRECAAAEQLSMGVVKRAA